MAELVIQIPDELAQQLQPFQEQLPQLLAQLVAIASVSPFQGKQSTAVSPVYNEILQFLLSRPTPTDIMAFKVSESSQARLRELLAKNRETNLSEAEESELDTFEQLDHFMILLKAQAYPLLQQ